MGLPWVVLPTRISPEGATRYGDNWFRTFEPDQLRVSGPFRAKRYFRLTQGTALLFTTTLPLIVINLSNFETM
jgi:hypothetical protein